MRVTATVQGVYTILNFNGVKTFSTEKKHPVNKIQLIRQINDGGCNWSKINPLNYFVE